MPTEPTTLADRNLLANHHITLGYYDLSERLARRLGRADANWCTWAAHASRSVGHALDLEEPPLLVRQRLVAMGLPRPLVEVVLDVLLSLVGGPAAHRASMLAAGNQALFTMSAGFFGQLCDLLDADADEAEQERVLAGLATGDGARPLAAAKRDVLRRGLRCYLKAAALPPGAGVDKARAELIFAGSLFISDFEQSFLQPDVDLAFLRTPAPVTSPLSALRMMVGELAAPLLTRLTVALVLPGCVIAPADGLPPAPAGQARHPAELALLTTPEARRALAAYDATAGDPRRCRVADWSVFADRMSFVAGLYRAWQRRPELFENPLSAQAEAAVRATPSPLVIPEPPGPAAPWRCERGAA
ncbi:MAG: hypothetical protein ACKVWR_12605 [Acidimicrobiales bacterium]